MTETPIPNQAAMDCSREPIHIPGAIQPHGVLLGLDPKTNSVRFGAGSVETVAGRDDWIGRPLSDLLGAEIADGLKAMLADGRDQGMVGRWRSADGQDHDVATHRTGDFQIIEIEPAGQTFSGSDLLARVETAGAAFERATSVKAACEQAATVFRALTGFDRVMIYRFLDDDAGVVVAEALAPGLPSFLNHHFPGSDIPAQARALYVRNRVRVIPDVFYEPAPLRGDESLAEPLDMSDCALRSVSPVHLQYMRNMEVGASASVSIVRDGELWGLVACHNLKPLGISRDVRLAAAAIGQALGRQIALRDEAETYRERLRLRGLEDEFFARIPFQGALHSSIGRHLQYMARILHADGAAVVRGRDVIAHGSAPHPDQIKALARTLADRPGEDVLASHRLSRVLPEAEAYQAAASGVAAIVVDTDEPFVLMWFRAERIETVRWAGDPHAAVKSTTDGPLSPRASFDAWAETVRGQSARWTLAEREALSRMRQTIFDLRGQRQLRRLNAALAQTVSDKERLLEQQDYLLREVNHRVQNSLTMVSSFLALQMRGTGEDTAAALDEARRRISAVGLVHQRLYRADQFETIDLARYFGELLEEMGQSMGREWAEGLTLDLAPVMIETGRAVNLGLILTELVINAQKYAYGGQPGPIAVTLSEARGRLKLTVADQGEGDSDVIKGGGFGSRMIQGLVQQLEGELARKPGDPGLVVTVSAPVAVDA